MLHGLFVTGTDTGIGKTVVSAALMHRYRKAARLRYWKPIQTGIELDDDTATVQQLGGCAPVEILAEGVRLPGAVAPYLAAERQGTRIAVEDLVPFVAAQAATCAWIVEGAGGPLVPINESEFMTDLILRLGLPALVVARSTLGTIHHTLATLETLTHRAIPVAGVVMVGPPNAENRKAIESRGNVEVLGEMPVFADLTTASLRDWALAQLDVRGTLTSMVHTP